VDGRLWQTLFLLLLRPGRLTQEYFAERRTRYLPPVRLYLVLSVLFFAFFLLGPHRANQMSGLPDANNTSAASQTAPQEKKRQGFSLDASDCDKLHTSFKWLENPLHRACLRNANSGGQAWITGSIANIPKMMFVFVPMIALVMLVLYWRPRRYYVEHLVFFLHNHAAIFLILLLEALLGWMAELLGWRAFGRWVIVFTTFYTVWYVFSAMRVYYAQGRWLTCSKFIVVGFAYTAGLTATLLVTLIVSALTV